MANNFKSAGTSKKNAAKSRAELEELARYAAAELAKLDEEEARRKRIKDEYHIEPFEYEWKVNYYIFHLKVCEAVVAGTVIDSEVLKELIKNSSEAKAIEYGQIYRCPECGELGVLFPGTFEYPHSAAEGYAISCSNCSFSLANKPHSSIWAAWETFHEWLIKNGFLDKGTKQPVQRPTRW